MAVVIAVIALVIFGLFILRQRRKRRNATEQLLIVEPFRVNPQTEKELPPPPMSEQRMTFDSLYGKPGPERDGTAPYQSYPSYPSMPQYTNGPITESPFSDAAALPNDNRATGGRSLTSPFGDSPQTGSNPFADPAGTGQVSSSPSPSSVVQAPPAAAIQHMPSYTASGGHAEELTRISGSGPSPLPMRSGFGVLSYPSTPAARSGELGKMIQTRPVSAYNPDDAYDGI